MIEKQILDLFAEVVVSNIPDLHNGIQVFKEELKELISKEQLSKLLECRIGPARDLTRKAYISLERVNDHPRLIKLINGTRFGGATLQARGYRLQRIAVVVEPVVVVKVEEAEEP